MRPGFTARVADFWSTANSGQRASAPAELLRAAARVAVKFGFTKEEAARVVQDYDPYVEDPHPVGCAVVAALAAADLLGVDAGEDCEEALQRMWDGGI